MRIGAAASGCGLKPRCPRGPGTPPAARTVPHEWKGHAWGDQPHCAFSRAVWAQLERLHEAPLACPADPFGNGTRPQASHQPLEPRPPHCCAAPEGVARLGTEPLQPVAGPLDTHVEQSRLQARRDPDKALGMGLRVGEKPASQTFVGRVEPLPRQRE